MANQVPPNYIEGAEITGVCNGTVAHYVRDCRIGTIATPLTVNAGAVFVSSGLVNIALKDAAGAALDIEFLDCHGNTQGSMFPGGTVDFGVTAGTNHEVAFQRWGGPVTRSCVSTVGRTSYDKEPKIRRYSICTWKWHVYSRFFLYRRFIPCSWDD